MVEVVRVQSQLVAGRRKRVTHAELGEFFSMAVNATATAGVLVSGPATAVYHDDAGESFDTTIGLPVSAMPDSALGLDVAELPGGSVLRVAHAGRYETLGEAYRELEAALAHRGLHRTLSWERYLVGPADDPDPERWITEVVVPLPE